MTKILYLIIFAITISQNLYSLEFLDTNDNNKIYQRSKYSNAPNNEISNTLNSNSITNNTGIKLFPIPQWDNVEKITSKEYYTLDYVKRNGNLEYKRLSQVPNESISSFEIGAEYYESYMFIDSSKKRNLMYYNNFNLSTIIAYHNFTNANDPNIEAKTYLDYGFGFVYSRGYGWTLSEKSNISLYKSLGVSLNQFAISTSNSTLLGIGDYFETGVRYQASKKIAFSVSYRENLTHFSLGFENWALSKILEVGGSGLLDKFITTIFVNKKYQLTPVYQMIYQSAWSYLFYSLKKQNPYFPFSNKTEEYAIPDNRFVVGIKVNISDSFR